MRVTLSDARESPVAAAVLLLGLGAAAIAVLFGDGEFGAEPGSPLFLVGVAFAAIAIAVSLAYRIRD